MKLRKFVFTLHQFAGLAVGALLLVIGLTGSALVFWHPLDRAVYPALFAAGEARAVSLDKVVEAARAAHPDLTPRWLGREEGNVYTVDFETRSGQSLQVFVDPERNRALGERVWEESLFGFVYELHYRLLAGKNGELVTGMLAILLALLGLSGLVLWPGWRQWRFGFSLRQQLWLFDLHKLTGIMTSAFLVVLGITGAAFMFYDPFKVAVYAMTGTPMPATLTSEPAGKMLSPDAALARARPLLAGAEFWSMSLPSEAKATYRILARLPGEAPATGRIYVYADAYSGKILRVEDWRKANAAETVLHWLGPLHFGTFGGLASQIGYLLVGLAPGGLFLTGFRLWLKKLRRPQMATTVHSS